MRLEDLDYDLPPERIAQEPPPQRGGARLLVLPRTDGALIHSQVAELRSYLRPGDLLVANDTRVLPARVYAERPTGGRVEVLFLEPVGARDATWTALLKAGGRPKVGEALAVGEEARIELRARADDGTWEVRTSGLEPCELMRRHGVMPLPPYIRRESADARAALDRERYQTVFAATEGAVAAPTAGLHLTEAQLTALRDQGIRVATITLHVGRGTFEPVRVDDLDGHPMHTERYEVPSETARAVRDTREVGGRVVAVGTTSVRTLEAAAAGTADGLPRSGSSTTDLLIQPGYRFQVVDALLTNFHLPRSTLLALVSAFAGRERVLAAYAEAVRESYRFYSYGDAMFIA